MARPKKNNNNADIDIAEPEVPPEVPAQPDYSTPGGAPMVGYPGIIREDK